jgi:hypothetical protein
MHRAAKAVSPKSTILESVTDNTTIPRSKSVLEKDEPQGASFSTFFFAKLKMLYIENIPLSFVRTLPSSYYLSLGILTYMIPMTIFIYLTVTTYDQLSRQQFVSLDVSSGLCQSVDKPVTGVYKASSSGYWQGSPDFLFEEAMYEFVFSSLQTNTHAFYNELMDLKEGFLIPLGEMAKAQMLPYTLLIWMNYAKPFIIDNKKHIFRFTGTKPTIFMSCNVANFPSSIIAFKRYFVTITRCP